MLVMAYGRHTTTYEQINQRKDSTQRVPHLDGAVQRCTREGVGVLGVKHHLFPTAQCIQ